ncbi:error-prone DNA polymerase [Lysobacter yangpyeongensis]|uniref:Error-prone DNA polymerase n=1 Tax=Lysobacter yangpyeongensis TaxID=346182 RepID=A0ABW0SIP4_9GAMM
MSDFVALPAYAELHCLSNFSFQRGASNARELFERAKQQGYTALAITDECSLAGIVRALQAAEAVDLKLIVGSEFRIEGGLKLVLLAETLVGYQRLCKLITLARRRAEKGAYRSLREDFAGTNEGLLALWIPGDKPDPEEARWIGARFPQRTWLAVELHRGPDDAGRLHTLLRLAEQLAIPAVASGDVHMHVRKRRALQDTMTAIRLHTTLAEAGHALFPNGERHLRTRQALAAIYPAELLAESVRIAARCRFNLRDPQYQYPHELVPAGHTARSWLRRLTTQGIRERWRRKVSTAAQKAKAIELIRKELRIIARKQYESYFLTVHDIVRFARSREILCQGRGSAANSAVCYALGITELQPGEMELLFERFVSEERNEPPDIDVDFEHERREEVMQYVFNRYGRERAALTAVATRYRGRSAVRDVAKALGLPADQIEELAKTMDRWGEEVPPAEFLREHGFDPEAPVIQRVIALTDQLLGFPRHLSQHPGGFVISERPLSTIGPIENAAMDDRTVLQWDKDDLDVLGLLKVDCLALGMLTCIRKTFDLLRDSGRRDLDLDRIPRDDPQTYALIQAADTVGVFQIESRAQMAMLPRLKPKKFYDLVIQVAIVRPGPIQGDMVHPYLRRRSGEEPVTYPSEKLRHIFERTLGVPLFQEQVMQLAIDAADYTPGEADQLRRSMAAWKRYGDMHGHRERIIGGMLKNGYALDFAERIFEQIKGFGSYGFPESHAASFALLAYASSWLKRHEPAAFAAALINSQPMGFYSPSQIVQDARRHGIKVRPVDVRYSRWDCTLEAGSHGSPLSDPQSQPALRLGLRMVNGFREDAAQRIETARAQRPFRDVTELCLRADLDQRLRGVLADAAALRGLAGHRHRARWAAAGVEAQLPLLDPIGATAEANVSLPLPDAAEDVRADYATVGLTLGRHPLSFLRARLRARRFKRSSELREMKHGQRVSFAGLVTMRQRPQTASGVTFITLEDEDGLVNAVVWQQVAERQRREFLESRLMAIDGRIECADGVRHLIATRLQNLTPMLSGLTTSSRDFH